MDTCHLKKCGVGTKNQKFKGRAVFRVDSGACAVITEQGSSASQMNAAKVLDVIARLPDCDGEAADAVPAYTLVKMEDAPRLRRIPKSDCPQTCLRLPLHEWPKSWSDIEEKKFFHLDGKKYRIWERLFVHRKPECCSHVEEIDETCRS